SHGCGRQRKAGRDLAATRALCPPRAPQRFQTRGERCPLCADGAGHNSIARNHSGLGGQPLPRLFLLRVGKSVAPGHPRARGCLSTVRRGCARLWDYPGALNRSDLACRLMPRESAVEKKLRTSKVIAGLRRAYPEAHCELNFGNPLELLIATILSAQA